MFIRNPARKLISMKVLMKWVVCATSLLSLTQKKSGVNGVSDTTGRVTLRYRPNTVRDNRFNEQFKHFILSDIIRFIFYIDIQ